MIKIAFFFDDNKLIQEFSELRFDKVGLSSVGFFSKTKEAVEDLAVVNPQIIMTDDSFSDMAESEFLSEIKDSFHNAVLIKYGDINSFDRVRSAFKLGYTDYVTVADYMSDHYEMFLDIVSSNEFIVEDSYEVKIQRENDIKRYAYGYSNAMVLKHNVNPEAVFFGSIAIVNFDALAKDQWAYEKEQMLFAFKNIISELIEEYENGEFFFDYYSQVYFAFSPSETVDKNYVKRAIKDIADTLRKILGAISFCIVMDEPIKLNMFVECCHKKIDTSNILHIVANDYVYFLDDLQRDFVEKFDSPRKSKKFEVLLDNLDFEEAVNEIRSLYEIHPSKEEVPNFIDYIKFVFNGIRQLDIQNQVGLIKEDDINKIVSIYNLPVIIEYFVCCIYSISDFISEDKYVSLQISKYLQEHLSDNITLQNISDNFNFEYTYTSKYFTQIMGMPFKKYFNNLRLSTALNLLKSSDLKCYEIAAKCGYNNYEHFSRIFYRKYGIWPKEIIRQKKH